jgi:hypothetical protein
MAAGARSKALSFGLLLTVQLISQVPAFLAVIGILFLGTRRSKPVGYWLDNYQWIILGLLVFASDSLLMLSNAQVLAMPLLGVFAILFAGRVTAERQQLPSLEGANRVAAPRLRARAVRSSGRTSIRLGSGGLGKWRLSESSILGDISPGSIY